MQDKSKGLLLEKPQGLAFGVPTTFLHEFGSREQLEAKAGKLLGD